MARLYSLGPHQDGSSAAIPRVASRLAAWRRRLTRRWPGPFGLATPTTLSAGSDLAAPASAEVCILAVGLRLPDSLDLDLSGIADPQLETKFCQQPLEPA